MHLLYTTLLSYFRRVTGYSFLTLFRMLTTAQRICVKRKKKKFSVAVSNNLVMITQKLSIQNAKPSLTPYPSKWWSVTGLQRAIKRIRELAGNRLWGEYFYGHLLFSFLLKVEREERKGWEEGTSTGMKTNELLF